MGFHLPRRALTRPFPSGSRPGAGPSALGVTSQPLSIGSSDAESPSVFRGDARSLPAPLASRWRRWPSHFPRFSPAPPPCPPRARGGVRARPAQPAHPATRCEQRGPYPAVGSAREPAATGTGPSLRSTITAAAPPPRLPPLRPAPAPHGRGRAGTAGAGNRRPAPAHARAANPGAGGQCAPTARRCIAPRALTG